MGEQTFEQKVLSTLLKLPSGNWVVKYIQVDANGDPIVPPTPGSAVWGFITGTLANQTDLQTALNAKEALANKATSFGTLNNTLYPTTQAVATYVASMVAGLLDLRGAYDASSNLFPSTGGSGTAGAILKGDFYIVSVGGNLGGTTVVPYQGFFSLIDSPGQTAANWDILPVTMAFSLPITAPINTVVIKASDNFPVAQTDGVNNLTLITRDIAGNQNTGGGGVFWDDNGNLIMLSTQSTANWILKSKASILAYVNPSGTFGDTTFTNDLEGTANIFPSLVEENNGVIYLSLTGDLSLWIGASVITGVQSGETADINGIDIEKGILPKGQNILITDAANTDGGLIVMCPTTNTFASSGLGKFLNNDWANVGQYDSITSNPNYSGIEWQTGVVPIGNLGQWYADLGLTITLNYSGLTGGIFAPDDIITDPTSGATAKVVTDNGSNSLTCYVNGSQFNPTDGFNNGAGVSATVTTSTGNPIFGIIVFWNGFNYQLTNSLNIVYGQNPDDSGAYTVLDKSTANVGYVEVWDEVIYDLINSYLCLREDENGNRVEDSFNEGTGAIQVFQWGNPNCQGNAVKCGSLWDCQNNAGTILNNVLENFATVTTDSTNAGSINGNQISAGQITLNKDQSFDFRNNVFRGNSSTNYIINNTQSDDLKRFESGFSNFECTVDITGLTTLDITALNNYCGIINLTGGATEGINLITNRPIVPFTLLFPLITAFTVTGTSATIVGTNQIVLPTASYVGNGTNGDFIKLQNDTINSSAVSKQIDAINNI